MKARFLLFLDGVRAAYWFIPAVMLVGSALLAVGLVVLDQRVNTDTLRGIWWVFNGGAEGARTLLSTVAGSVIAVAGTTFSITIAVLSLTSSQFGPRLLRGFLRDTANQVVLGTFVSTFLYCLLILRMVRGVEEVAFVPHIAVTGGVVLAIASIAVLIFFIHHVSTSIQASRIIAKASAELEEAINRLFPEDIGNEASPLTDTVRDFADLGPSSPIFSRESGYVQALDGEALLGLAREKNVVLNLRHTPGQFVARGSTLAEVWPTVSADEELENEINDAFSLGEQRTSTQDTEFLMLQLVEIAVRALSPGTNDPFTASMCLDRLGEALCHLAGRGFPSATRSDDGGKVRVIAPSVGFADMTELAFSEIRHYGSADPLVATRLLSVIGDIAECAPEGERRDNLVDHLWLARTAALAAATEDRHKTHFEEQYRAAMKRLKKVPAAP